MKCRSSLLFAAVLVMRGRCPGSPPRSGSQSVRRGRDRRSGPEQPGPAGRTRQPVDRRRRVDHGPPAAQSRCCRASANSLDWLGHRVRRGQRRRARREYSVRVDVPFERGRKRDLRIDVADQSERLAEAQFADAVRRLKLDVAIAEHRRPRGQGQAAAREDNLQTFERLVQLNERRLASGAIPPLEVTRSRVAMLQYRSSRQDRAARGQPGPSETAAAARPTAGRSAGRHRRSRWASPPQQAPDLPALQQAAQLAARSRRAPHATRRARRPIFVSQSAQGKVDYTLGAEYRRQQGVNGQGQHARPLRQRSAARLQPQPGRNRASRGRRREGRRVR